MTTQPAAPTLAHQRRYSVDSIAALVCGILGLPGNFLALLAVLAGIGALWTAHRRGAEYRGTPLAIAGLVLGCAGLMVGMVLHA